jgi:hypothetical protein
VAHRAARYHWARDVSHEDEIEHALSHEASRKIQALLAEGRLTFLALATHAQDYLQNVLKNDWGSASARVGAFVPVRCRS